MFVPPFIYVLPFPRYFTGKHEGMELCIVLDGHDGEKVADFVCQMLPGILLAEKIMGGPQAVFEKINTAFRKTETEFFISLGDPLMRKISLQNEIHVSNYYTCTCIL